MVIAPPCAQVREFWHELESATNERQAAMFGLLNGHLARQAPSSESSETSDPDQKPKTTKKP